jgi:hypothetical protein
MMLRRGVNGLLGQLVNEGLLAEEALGPAREAAHAARSPTPWFVRALLGVGAWVSAGVLILFLAVTKLLDGQASLVVLGLLFYAGGVALRWAVESDYPVQFSLAAGLAGGTMVLVGVADGAGQATTIGASLALSLVTVAVFPDVVMRFIATCGACAALVLGCHELELGPDGAVAVIAVLGGLAWHLEPRLLSSEVLRGVQRPVAWGLVVSLVVLQVSTVMEELDRAFRVGPAASLSVAVALVVLVLAVAREHHASFTSEPVLVALGAVLVLGAVMLKSPGVLAALYVAALAFHRRSPLMLGLAILSLAVFLGNFYFRMELTLLLRSVVLLASGALLLGLREYVRRRFGPFAEEELP